MRKIGTIVCFALPAALALGGCAASLNHLRIPLTVGPDAVNPTIDRRVVISDLRPSAERQAP